MIESISLAPGVRLHYLKDSRFKQGCMSIQFITPMNRSTACLNALLPNVLLRGSANHPDMRAITLHMDDLYGTAISPMTRRIGDLQATGLYAGFISDRFALPGDRLLAHVVEFLKELLYEPLLEDGVFRRDYVEGEKRNLISTIETDLNDKRIYAMTRMLQTMCKADSFGIPRLGTVEDVQAVTPQSLFDHYRNLLQTAPVDICYVGGSEAEEVAELLRPLFGADRQTAPIPAQTPFHEVGTDNVTEYMGVAQAKLCMGFTCGITNRDADFAAMQVLNTIYGSGMTCKLFQNVREKLSLCYYVGSSYYSSKGIMLVSAGVDSANIERAKEEILTQLELCVQGSISPEELTAAKAALISALRATPDSPGALEGYYTTASLSGLARDLDEYIAQVEAVTVEQAVAAARNIRLHTVYVLEGGAA